MNEIVYEPKCFKKPNAILEGSVKLSAPSIMQRFDYLEECGFEVKADGSVDVSLNKLAPVKKMIAVSKAHYVSVDVKYKDGSRVLKSVDDLFHDNSCDEMLVEVAAMILQGFSPSKN